MKRFSWKGPLFLLLAAFFWGTTFVAQDLASDAVGPFTFTGTRMILGALFLLPVVLIRNKGKLFKNAPTKEAKKELLSVSLLCATVMFFAANFQQIGISMGTGAGKSGFITAMYVVLVPVAGLLFGKKVRPLIWLCIAVSAVGLYLLCMASFEEGLAGLMGNLKMSAGDLMTLGCAVFYTAHIICIDMKATRVDGVLLSCLQFLFAGIVGLVVAFIFLFSPSSCCFFFRKAELFRYFGGLRRYSVFRFLFLLHCLHLPDPRAAMYPCRRGFHFDVYGVGVCRTFRPDRSEDRADLGGAARLYSDVYRHPLFQSGALFPRAKKEKSRRVDVLSDNRTSDMFFGSSIFFYLLDLRSEKC